MSMSLRAYMVWEGEPHDGAALVLAHNARDAKKIGQIECMLWGDGRWIDLRVKWLRDADIAHLTSLFGSEVGSCDTQRLMCASCKLWHAQPLTHGRCESCAEEFADEAAGAVAS